MAEKNEMPTAPQARRYHHDAEGRADHCCGVVFQPQRHRNIPRQAAQNDTCRQAGVKRETAYTDAQGTGGERLPQRRDERQDHNPDKGSGIVNLCPTALF